VVAGSGSADAATASERNVFAAELKRWRDVRGLSRTALARRMGYDRSYVSKVESGAERPSREFALHAEDALHAGGALRKAFQEYAAHRTPVPRPPVDPTELGERGAGSLVVEHDDATLRYDGRTYRLTQRRRLFNGGQEPVTRYLIRISVDRYPGSPERSNQLYRNKPLSWEEINLRAWCGQGRAEPMDWVAQHDRDAFKEVWLLFAHDTSRFPLYPGESCWIEYEYTVGDDKWGNWFQRAVRLPTRRLSVQLDFPAELQPVVWGLHTSMTAEAMPFPTPIRHVDVGDRQLYSWATQDPPLHARYRLEWDFRGRTRPPDEPPPRPSQTMRALGIVQEGEPILRQAARTFRLPEEAEDARRVIAELHAASERVAKAHTFGKGMGIAAPQLGIDRAAAIVQPPDAEPAITLLNPRIIESSQDTDEQYEGCLSLFDVRGLVPRPLVIHVEHTDITGAKHITVFERGIARLVAHEVDHLHGRLYTDHLALEASLIPVEQYHGTGTPWKY
jgi:peptide deformylase